MKLRSAVLTAAAALVVLSSCEQTEAPIRPDLSGIYRPQGLAVQPCGYNEWTRRSFETDLWCFGVEDGFPFTEAGRAAWKSYSPIEDPVLRCIERFPRSAMRGRPMRLTVGENQTEIAYWFSARWHTRTVHMNGAPPPADTPHTDMGYSVGHWIGDSLIVETTHTIGGPMFNDHKQSSPNARIIERFWLAPDGRNLLMDVTLDDPEYYTKPFLLNRQEWIYAPDRPLSDTECTPSSIWATPDENE
jgi:hypothetical protein